MERMGGTLDEPLTRPVRMEWPSSSWDTMETESATDGLGELANRLGIEILGGPRRLEALRAM